MIVSALQADTTAHSTVPADRIPSVPSPLATTNQAKSSDRNWTTARNLNNVPWQVYSMKRVSVEDQFVREKRMQQLDRNEVSGEAEGADQVREQRTREFQTEEIC